MKSFFAILCMIFSLTASISEAKWKNPFPFPSDAEDFRKRAQNKENSRWTLKDWLEQKEKNHMMDLWLGMYSPSPYELILTGAYADYETSFENPASKIDGFAYSGGIAFYALIIGLEAQYQNNWHESTNQLSTLLNLRIMGNAVQGTHLNLQYGVRKKTIPTDNTIEQQFAGADLDLYVDRYIGLHGNYRSYLPTKNDTLGDINERRTEAGLFFDFSFIRLFGQWFSEKHTTTLSGVDTNSETTGLETGLKLFF